MYVYSDYVFTIKREFLLYRKDILQS